MNFESASNKKFLHKGVTQLSYEVTKVLQNDPNRSPLYAVLCAINREKNTIEQLYNYFNYFYVNEFSYIRLTPPIIDAILNKGIKKGLIRNEQEVYLLTEKGFEILNKSTKVISISNKAIQVFFSERVVLLFSLLILIFMSSTKIVIGINNGSDALFNEGIENFTDIIKIGIIFLSIRFRKDKLGAILIIILMLTTGINLLFTSIFSIVEFHIISPNYISFIILFISIIFNLMLLFLKSFVGKLKSNFALLSDAKDNKNNIRLSFGVAIGLIFALFGIYIVDSLIGILIAVLIIIDGINTLTELIKSGDNMALENFKLKLDDAFEFKIIHWLLVMIYEEKVTMEKLNAKFIEAVSKGYNIFGVWAIFGLYDFEKFGIHNIIYLMKKNKLYYEKENILYLTRKGEKQYRKALSKEKVRITKEMKKYKNWKAPSRFDSDES